MTKKEQKRRTEIADIEQELRLLAMGACGSSSVEPDDEGCDLFTVFDAKAFSRWLTAVESRWQIHKRELESTYMLRPHSLDTWAESYTSAAEFLHRHGARANGKWIA